MYRRDIHVKWQFHLNIWWILLSSIYHTTLLIKRYMIAFPDDTRTKFICEIVFELAKIRRPELYISCYAFLVSCSSLNWNNKLNFHRLEVVYRYHGPQLEVGENYSYFFNSEPNICKSWWLNTHSFVKVLPKWHWKYVHGSCGDAKGWCVCACMGKWEGVEPTGSC